jgi:tetratricopeptide (TPR) repeat protein
LIADFSDSSAEAKLSGVVEPVLGLALEGAPFISNVNRTRAKDAAKKLDPNATAFDEKQARLYATQQGIDVVISGAISNRGPGYEISAKALESTSGKTLATASVSASNKEAVAGAVTTIAASLRTALGDTSSEQTKHNEAETFTTSSLEALRSYIQGQELVSAGKSEEAIRAYSFATKLDPDLGRAYAGIAAIYHNTGRRKEAEQYYQEALRHVDRMTDREKFRTRGGYFIFKMEADNAIGEYSKLVAQYPADTVGNGMLAYSYFLKRDFGGAVTKGAEFVDRYPKNVQAMNNVALYAMYAGDFVTADSWAAKALELNPNFEKNYLPKAMAALAQGRIREAISVFEKEKGVDSSGASRASAGLADIALYEGRIKDAQQILDSGVAADIAGGDSSSAADKLITLAAIYSESKDFKRATDFAERAVARSSDEEKILFGAARVYLAAGQQAKAVAIRKQLSEKLQDEWRAYARILEADELLAAKKPVDAIDRLKEAQKLADTWFGHLEMGRAYLEGNHPSEASSEFDLCVRHRGEATAVFLDDVPTYHLYPQVLYYQARAQEGMKSPGAVDQYKTFLTIKQNAENDPMVQDARARVK